MVVCRATFGFLRDCFNASITVYHVLCGIASGKAETVNQHGEYTTGLLDIPAPVCYNADNIRHGQPETGCCAEILFERSCRK